MRTYVCLGLFGTSHKGKTEITSRLVRQKLLESESSRSGIELSELVAILAATSIAKVQRD